MPITICTESEAFAEHKEQGDTTCGYCVGENNANAAA